MSETFEDMAARHREAAAAFQQDIRLLIESGYFRRPPARPVRYLPLFRRGPDDPGYWDTEETVTVGE